MQKKEKVTRKKNIPVILYRVTTGNYLPGTKRIFRTIGEAIQYIKKMVDRREAWVTNTYAQKSYSIVRINSRVLPEWSRIFKVNKIAKKVLAPTKSELGLRAKKRKPKRKGLI